MDSPIKLPPLLTDIKAMEWNFYLPIFVTIISTSYVYVVLAGWNQPLLFSEIKKTLGLWSIPCVSFWTIGLYKNLVDSDGKELLLAMPYKVMQYGFIRTLRMSLIYILFFYTCLLIVLLFSEENMTMVDWILPGVNILFFSFLSFVIILASKNIAISYGLIGVYSSTNFITYGSFSGWVYPFYWSLPRHDLQFLQVLMGLILATFVCIVLGQWILTKKEYLVK
ncbi:MAG TPA: hypothetical protein DDY49_11390 [Paenibacillaceae bacterium]|nr:hypothetical protein [Paenibacillaceae bacterium]